MQGQQQAFQSSWGNLAVQRKGHQLEDFKCMLVVAIAKEAQDLVLLLQWQQQACSLKSRREKSRLQGTRTFFCNGNNKHASLSKSSNQNQIILRLYFFKTKGILTLWHVKNFNVKNPM